MISQTHSLFGRAIVAAFALTAVLLPVIVRAEDRGVFTCPVLHNPIEKVTKDTQFSDYMGVRYFYCCEGCKPQFDKAQSKFLKDPKNKDKVLGVALFDVITSTRIEPGKAAAHSNFSGVRYFFAKEDDKKTFDKEPKKYTVSPKKEVLFCPVSNEIVESYEKASDYSDLKGSRYYFCCAGCKPAFDKNPEKYLEGLDARIKAAEQKKPTRPADKEK